MNKSLHHGGIISCRMFLRDSDDERDIIISFLEYMEELLRKCGHTHLPSLVLKGNFLVQYFLLSKHDYERCAKEVSDESVPSLVDSNFKELFHKYILSPPIEFAAHILVFESLHIHCWNAYSAYEWLSPSIREVMAPAAVYKVCFGIGKRDGSNRRVIFLLTKKCKGAEWERKMTWVDYSRDRNGMLVTLPECKSVPFPSLRNRAIKTIHQSRIAITPLPKVLQRELYKVFKKLDCKKSSDHHFYKFPM